jgi:mannose-6-phosphate isomerase-like protein (cupin superfamily)
MGKFITKVLGSKPDARAPDGSEVRLLPEMTRGGMAHFALGPRHISRAVTHKMIEEIWYFVGGRGRMWRRFGETEEVVDVFPGVSITIPAGTQFQFRSDSDEQLAAIGVTMPPWPGADEASQVEGIWEPNVTME